MRKILTLFSMQWSRLFQYRADLLLWFTSESVTPLVALAVWYTVAKSSTSGLTTQETLTYYILVIFVSISTNSWNGFFFAREILKGEIAKFLINPLSVFWRHIAENLVQKSLKLAIPLTALLVIMYYYPQLFIAEVYMLTNVILFILSLILAIVISFALDMSLGALAFWIEDANELRSYKIMLESITSGLLVPFALMPPFLFTLFSFLPFRYVISAPIEILMGQVTGPAATQLLLYQSIWAITLIVVLKFLWNKGLKVYAVPGQ